MLGGGLRMIQTGLAERRQKQRSGQRKSRHIPTQKYQTRKGSDGISARALSHDHQTDGEKLNIVRIVAEWLVDFKFPKSTDQHLKRKESRCQLCIAPEEHGDAAKKLHWRNHRSPENSWSKTHLDKVVRVGRRVADFWQAVIDYHGCQGPSQKKHDPVEVYSHTIDPIRDLAALRYRALDLAQG